MINIEHVSKQFGSLQVLEDISINIDQGDIFGIIGQSGMRSVIGSFSFERMNEAEKKLIHG